MSKKLRYRTPIVPHLFRKAVYHEDRCQHCGHGMPYNNPDGSAVHEQEAARRGAETALKMPQSKPEYYDAYDQALVEDRGSFAPDWEATNGIDQFVTTQETPNLAQEFRERQNVVFTNGVSGVTVSMDNDVINMISAQMALANWDLQTFVNLVSDMWREERDAGHEGVLEISRAHRVDAAAFRKHVANTAVKYAITHNWCDEVLACLSEIGIKLGPMHVRVEGSLVTPHSSSAITAHLLLPYEEIPVYRDNPIEWCSRVLPNISIHDAVLEDIEVVE